MAWTDITAPVQGEATLLAKFLALINNVIFLRTNQASSSPVPNGSFEDDGDADGVPDGWEKTLFTGGSFTHDDTDQRHGEWSAKFTSPGGASNGGGYLETEDFFPVTPLRPIDVLWEMKSSAAGVSNRVEVYWFKEDQTASTTPSSSVYSSTANPTSWTAMSATTTPPSDARYAKLRIIGCHTASTTAGSTWFDNVQVILASACGVQKFTSSGTFTPPAGCRFIQIEAVGGGGGGSGGLSTGGGGGAFSFGRYAVQEGIGLTVTVGAAGGAGSAGGGHGGAGGDTTVGSLITAAGGAAGTASAGGGGVAGGQVGVDGEAASGATGGKANFYLNPITKANGYGHGGDGTGAGAGNAGLAGVVVIRY